MMGAVAFFFYNGIVHRRRRQWDPFGGGPPREAWWRELTWHKCPLRLRPISRNQRVLRAFRFGEAL